MFSLTDQGTLHHGRKCRLQDREAAGPVTSTVRNRRGLLSSLSPFYIALNSCPGNGCTHNYSGASSTNIIKITPQRPTFPMRLNAVKLTISMNHSIEKAKQFFKSVPLSPGPNNIAQELQLNPMVPEFGGVYSQVLPSQYCGMVFSRH